MRKLLCCLLALALLTGAALAEFDFSEFEDAFGDGYEDFSFDDEGYDGAWVTIDALAMELCLPEDWTEQTASDGAVFAASKDDGTARLTLRLEAENVESILDWVQKNMTDADDYALEDAGLYASVVRESDGEVLVDVLTDGGSVVLFSFERASREALSRELALEIAGSLYEDAFAGDLWDGGEEWDEEEWDEEEWSEEDGEWVEGEWNDEDWTPVGEATV